MSKLLANQISNYNDNGPVEAKDGINVATGKPFQVAGASGTSGQYLKSTGSSVAWTTFPTTVAGYGITDAFSGSYADLTGKPTIPSNISDLGDVATTAPTNNQVLKWNGSSWTPAEDSAGIALNSISVSVNAVGVSNLTYNNSTGEFSYTPPDLSSYLTSVGIVSDHTDVNITNIQNDQVLKWDSTTSKWVNSSSGGGGSTTFAALTDTPANFTGQAGKFLKVNAGATALEYTDAPAGTTTFTGLTDTPANFTSQAGKYLKVNAGATALEYVTLPVDPDTNTTYSQSSVADGSNVKLRLTDSGSVNDDILITAGSNVTISAVTAGGFTIASTFTDTNTTYSHASIADGSNVKLRLTDSGSNNDDVLVTAGTNISFTSVTAAGFTINSTGANVTTDDNAPSSPSDGDLWWKSDEGRLKVYYDDGSGSPSAQWVDASPSVLNSSVTNTTTNGTNSINTTTSTSGANANAIEIKTDNNTASAVRWRFTPPGHFIPNVNAAYDIGNAEYKVRHLFLSDNTLYFEGDFLKVAQHNEVGTAQAPSYLIPLSKLKDALNASANYEAFKTAILAITDA